MGEVYYVYKVKGDVTMNEKVLQEALTYLKAEGTLITRKHVTSHGFTMYQHPCSSSTVIMVKNDRIMGQTNKVKILSDNSRTYRILETSDFLEFTL